MDLDTEELEATKKLNKEKKKDIADKLIENYNKKIYEMINEEER